MTPKKSLFLLAVAFTCLPFALAGQDAPSLPVDEIIRRFAAKEKEFALARSNYVYKQDVTVQTLGPGDRVTGEFRVTSDVGFDDRGRRSEKILYAPQSTLVGISMTSQDLQDLREIQPFVLTSDDIEKYKLKYVGKEAVDEITCYKFEVEPKKIEKGQRYFQGAIWVDDRDFQIVKTYGKAVPDIREKNNENLFPRFETYREQIDTYWFPTYTRSLDTLQFSTGDVRIKQIVRYDSYRKFGADVNLSFGGEVGADGKPVESSKPPVETDKNASPLDPRYRTTPAPGPSRR